MSELKEYVEKYHKETTVAKAVMREHLICHLHNIEDKNAGIDELLDVLLSDYSSGYLDDAVDVLNECSDLLPAYAAHLEDSDEHGEGSIDDDEHWYVVALSMMQSAIERWRAGQ